MDQDACFWSTGGGIDDSMDATVGVGGVAR